MTVVRVTGVIDAPADRVFAFVADGRSRAEWAAGGSEAAPIRIDRVEGDGGLGTRWHFHEDGGVGRRNSFAFTTAGLEPDSRVVFTSDESYGVSFDLEPVGGGTRVTYERDYGPLQRGLMRFVLRRAMNSEAARAGLAADLDRVATALGVAPVRPEGGEGESGAA